MPGTRHVTMVSSSYPTDAHPYHSPFVADLAERVADRGWQVHVVALVPPGAQPVVRPGVTATAVASPFWGTDGRGHRGGIPALLRTRPRAIARVPGALRGLRRGVAAVAARTDLIHAHWIPTRLSAAGLGRPVVTTAHGADVRLVERLPVAGARVCGAGPLLVGTAELERRLAAVAPAASLLRVPPVGLEPPTRPLPAPVPLRALAIMRLAPEKGVEELAAAWQTVLRALPGAELRVVGDGPLHAALELPGVTLVGNVPPTRIPDEIGAASLVVQASRHEPYGIATLEALIHGRPVVATATGIAAETITPEIGRLVPVGDAGALAAVLVELLPQTAELARMGALAAPRAATAFTWEAALDALEEAYLRAIADGPEPPAQRRPAPVGGRAG